MLLPCDNSNSGFDWTEVTYLILNTYGEKEKKYYCFCDDLF